MTDDEYTEFIIAEPDPDNIQVGYWNERFLVKRTDGTIRYIYPTTLPPP